MTWTQCTNPNPTPQVGSTALSCPQHQLSGIGVTVLEESAVKPGWGQP